MRDNLSTGVPECNIFSLDRQTTSDKTLLTVFFIFKNAYTTKYDHIQPMFLSFQLPP